MAIIINSPSAKFEIKNQDQFDIWTSVKSSTAKNNDDFDHLAQPYVHPMLRRSASFMSQASLDSCTEGLGSETGSDRFVDFDDFDCYSCSDDDDSEDEEKEEEEFGVEVDSIGGSFPPPISSIRHREMRVRRRDGRLVLESIAVGSRKKSLCCQRQDGRLLLSFVDDPVTNRDTEFEKEEEDEDDDEEEEEEEDVEVVDRGIIVEVKIHQSTSFVINKFVGVDINTMEPEKPEDKNPPEEEPDISGLKWVPPEVMSTANPDLPNQMTPKEVTSVKKRESILEHMKKRCNLELNRPLFILEPCYVAAAAT